MELWVIVIYPLVLCFFAHVVDYFRYTHRTLHFNICTVSNSYSLPILLYLWFTFSDNLSIFSIFVSLLAGCSIVSIIIFLVVYKELGLRFVFYKLDEIPLQIKVGLPLVLTFFVEFIMTAADRFLIGIFLNR